MTSRLRQWSRVRHSWKHGAAKARASKASLRCSAPGNWRKTLGAAMNELGKIATYRTLGGTLDENDAYVAEALEAVGFSNWASIRNVSDLPGALDDQYDQFGTCSSIYGAYALWAFVMGH